MQAGWKKQLARLVSNLLNPFLVSAVVIVILSFEATGSTLEALKWSLVMTALSVVPVFAVVVYLVRHRKLDGIFINPRRQRTRIYLLATLCAVAGCIVLRYLGAPPVLMAAFVAGLSAVTIFLLVNMRWKISAHSGFVAASVTALAIIYGYVAALSAVLLLLIAWSRVELKYHSLAEVVFGALLASLTVIVVFYFFGLLGAAVPA